MNTGTDNFDDGVKRRISSLGGDVVERLIATLISQCYNITRFMVIPAVPDDTTMSVSIFCDMFNRFVIYNGIGLLLYDNISEAFWMLDVKSIQDLSIEETDRSNTLSYLGFPEYMVKFKYEMTYSRQGDAEHLYNLCGEIVRKQFESGWERSNVLNIEPIGVLTPHDLCAHTNYMELANRLLLYMMYSLDIVSFNKYSFNIPGFVLTDRWMLMSMQFLFHVCSCGYTKVIKQPLDMISGIPGYAHKTYIISAVANFHQAKLDLSSIPFFLRHEIIDKTEDKEDLRLIPMGEEVGIRCDMFTSVKTNAYQQ